MRIFSVSCLSFEMVTLLKPSIKENLSHKLNGSNVLSYRPVNVRKTHNKLVGATATRCENVQKSNLFQIQICVIFE